MKKSGFTLAEIIVTLTIIGIIAALIAPKINVLIPDKNKIKIIKYYNLINDGIESMLGDTDLYHPSWQAVNINNVDVEIFTANGTDPCVGLQCIEQLKPSGEQQSYITRQLRDKLGLNNDNIAADGSTITMTDFDSTSEEMSVTIRTAPGKGNCQSRVLTIQPPENISPCGTLKQVDTFTFKIDKYGTISPTDVLTKIYLQNATDMNNRRTDFNEANTLIASLNKEAEAIDAQKTLENAKNRAKESRSKANDYLTENKKNMSQKDLKELKNLLNDLDKMLGGDNATSDDINKLSDQLDDMLEGLKNNIDTQSVLDDTTKFIEEYQNRASEELLNNLINLNNRLNETQNREDASPDEIRDIISQINELKNQIETEADPDIAESAF